MLDGLMLDGLMDGWMFNLSKSSVEENTVES